MIALDDGQDYERQPARMEQLEEQAKFRASLKPYWERTLAEERLLEDGECEE